jgi:hypothetical protein
MSISFHWCNPTELFYAVIDLLTFALVPIHRIIQRFGMNLDHLAIASIIHRSCITYENTWKGVTFVPAMISRTAAAERKYCLSLRASISRGDKLERSAGCRRDERERGSWMKNLLQRRWLARGRWWWTSEGRVNGSTVCQMVWRCRRCADPVPLLFHNNREGSSRSLVKRSNIIDDNCHETDLWQTMVFYELGRFIAPRFL